MEKKYCSHFPWHFVVIGKLFWTKHVKEKRDRFLKLISMIEKNACCDDVDGKESKGSTELWFQNQMQQVIYKKKTDKMHLARRRKLAHGIPTGSGMGCNANSAAEFCGAGLNGRHRLCLLREQVYERIIYWFNGAGFESLTRIDGDGIIPKCHHKCKNDKWHQCGEIRVSTMQMTKVQLVVLIWRSWFSRWQYQCKLGISGQQTQHSKNYA